MEAPTLTDFLLARIAEDEAVARAATPGPWRDCPMGSEGSNVYAGGETVRTARRPARCGEFADAAHIARHDPGRVLAECEAKRQIVEALARAGEGEYGGYGAAIEYAQEIVLGSLALPYADHEDFREAWKP